ncbi:phosphotransferase family protein [Streptomyces sp. NPDC101160]|uniref:phosphotransferase family protein n=1 Tax=Streptomyces sp. NPDC101160 TaxID=3366118 RepID=UPI0038115E9B
MEETDLTRLHALARAAAHPDGASSCPCPVDLLADRDDGTVVRHGDLVLKAHAPGGDPEELRSRTAVAALPALADVLLPPLPAPSLPSPPFLAVPFPAPSLPASPFPASPPPAPSLPASAFPPLPPSAPSLPASAFPPLPPSAPSLPATPFPSPPLPASLPAPRTSAPAENRPLTAWPYGVPVDPADPDAAPWEAAARLLALLHRTPAPPGLPAMRAPVKAALAVERMRRAAPDHPATATVLRAWRTVPEPAEAGPGPYRALCHGDFHLGQLVRPGGGPHWRLIDVDDLGVGDPAWDLARPAAWFAAGLLAPQVWARFLGAYEAAGGPATAAPGQAPGQAPGSDPWSRLDVPARALTVQTAALAVAKSTVEERPLDEVEDVMIDTCARIGTLRTELAPPASP